MLLLYIFLSYKTHICRNMKICQYFHISILKKHKYLENVNIYLEKCLNV